MADGVKGAQKFFWTLVDNWKKNKDADLHLSSVDGNLMVKYSMNLGVWVSPTTKHTTKPPSDSATRSHQSHQGPRKGVGPSRQRRRERRAADRAAASAEPVKATSEEVATESTDKSETTVNITEEVGINVDKEVAVDSSKNVSKETFVEAKKGAHLHKPRCGQAILTHVA